MKFSCENRRLFYRFNLEYCFFKQVVLGTISNVEEAVEWLSYTYLFVRMRLNHLAYGIEYQTIVEDSNLEKKRKEFIHTSAMALDKAMMIRYNTTTGDLNATGLLSII